MSSLAPTVPVQRRRLVSKVQVLNRHRTEAGPWFEQRRIRTDSFARSILVRRTRGKSATQCDRTAPAAGYPVDRTRVFTGEHSPISNLLKPLLGTVAEFERSQIRERQREGISLAKKAGVYKGRKPSLTPYQLLRFAGASRRGSRRPDWKPNTGYRAKPCTQRSLEGLRQAVN
jgi:hypothetical protein